MKHGATLPALLLAAAQAAAGERFQDFSSDPGWDGHRNRLLASPAPRTRQDFGYSSTRFAGGRRDGEVGGRVQRSITPAWYARRIPVKTLEDRLEASGKFAVTRDDGASGLLIGWFHEASRGWRTPNSLAFRIDGNGGRYWVLFEYGTRNWLTGGGATFEGDYQTTATKPFLADGTPHSWKLAYDPAGNSGGGEITFVLDSSTYTAQLLPGHRMDGASFNRFGILNQQTSGKSMDVWLDDVTVNELSADFDSDPAWESAGSRAEHEDRLIRPLQDFGFSSTDHAGGATGELGGILWRDETSAYYADRVGPLTLEDELHASGKLAFTGAGSDSGVYIGWFSSQEMKKVTREAPQFLKSFVAVLMEGPSRVGHYFRPAYATAAGGGMIAEDGPIIRPDSKPHEWSIRYSPVGAGGRGLITVRLDGEARALEMSPGHRASGADLDRFGIFSAQPGGHYVLLFLDEVRYTASR